MCGVAKILYAQEEYEKASEKYMQILQINPNEVSAYYKLANIFYRQNDNDLALRYITEAVKFDNKNSRYHHLCAKILAEMSLFQNSMEQYSQAIFYEPDNVEWLLEFSDVLFLNQEIQKAINTAERALRIENKNREIFKRLILFNGEIGNKKEQIKFLKKYLSFSRDAEFAEMLKELSSGKNKNGK